MSDVKLQTAVTKQLPEFIREDYATLTAFIKAYYEYLESVDARNIEDLRNVDKTVYEYLVYVNNEIGFLNAPDLSIVNIDPRLLLRKTKQAFIAKGTEDSYRFLFRLFFNKSIDIKYPWDEVLKTSDGKWRQDTSIFVQVTSGDVLTIVGDRVTVLGTNTRLKVYIDRVTHIRDNIYELFIDKSFYGQILLGDTVNFEGFSGVIIPTTVKYVIQFAGSGYTVGDVISSDITVGSTIVKQMLKVTKVNSTGGILGVNTVKFGCGYSSDFFVSALKTTTPTINSSISISRNSINKYSAKDTSKVDSYTETGTIINNNVWEGAYTDPFYAGSLLNGFNNETSNLVDMSTVAIIKCVIGPVAKYQGYYISSDGFLDDTIKIQDSKFWQKYAYTLVVDERLVDFKTYVKSFIHTAGLALFAEYQLQNTYQPGIEASVSLDTYISKATFTTRNKTVSTDYFIPRDLGGRIRKNSYDQDYFEVTYNPETYQTFPT
jgi:hypothetical protein